MVDNKPLLTGAATLEAPEDGPKTMTAQSIVDMDYKDFETTFQNLTPEEIHTIPEAEFQKLPLRKRYEMYFESAAGSNNMGNGPLAIIFVLYTVWGIIWFSVFNWLVRDRYEDFFSDVNMRKFVLYNILHGVLGFGASCGPLGSKMKVPFGATMATYLTPGTMSSPLFPKFVGLLQKTPCQRSVLTVIAFIAYVAALVRAIHDPSISNMVIANAALGVCSIFDFSIFFASRGEHYGYHMFCMMFPDWVAGCQWVQVVLWCFTGCSKCGPWFKYVIQVLVKDAIWTPCLPKNFSARLFNKDWPRDYSPSNVSRTLAVMGAVGEWVFPLSCVAASGTLINSIGVFGMISYHGIIWCTLPMASVFEWQYYTMFMTYFLYSVHTFTFPTSPVLIGFLVVVLVVFPIVGQFEPNLVPFLMGYRQYAGNWRLGWWIIKKTAKESKDEKINKIKTYNPIFGWEAAPEAFGGFRSDYLMAASFMVVPQFRGMFSVLEKFFKDNNYSPDEFYIVNSFGVSNAVFGWDLAVGWLWYRECFRQGVLDICGFEEKECYVLQCEPVRNLPPYNLQYRLMDMKKGPLDAEINVDIPYSALEGTHPMRVQLEPEQMQRGKSIRGTFLSTYY